jgi:AcrR family transcriptional regulator
MLRVIQEPGVAGLPGATVMRITAEAKEATRRRIVESTAELLAEHGWERTTTRAIAAEAGIAAGTLFNYFQSKEAITAVLIGDALAAGEGDFRRERRREQSLEEDLFLLIWTGLKRLRKYRGWLAAAAETIFSPLAQYAAEPVGDWIRVRHLETVGRVMAGHGVANPAAEPGMQLYWILYLGVFCYWTADASAHQEDTPALLERSVKLFIGSLEAGKGRE